jgi:hypothetical protein
VDKQKMLRAITNGTVINNSNWVYAGDTQKHAQLARTQTPHTITNGTVINNSNWV